MRPIQLALFRSQQFDAMVLYGRDDATAGLRFTAIVNLPWTDAEWIFSDSGWAAGEMKNACP